MPKDPRSPPDQFYYLMSGNKTETPKTKAGVRFEDVFTEEQKAKFRAQDALYDETMKTS